jgi:hypothetical protein
MKHLKLFKKYVYESVDELDYRDGLHNYQDENVYPFFWTNDGGIKVKMGYESSDHGTNVIDGSVPDEYHNSGRIFITPKVITFYDYPKVEEWRKFIEELEWKTELKIWNNGWRVEIYTSENEEELRKIPNVKIEDYDALIPVEYYFGSSLSKKGAEKRLLHLLDLETKAKMIKPEHFGSKADKRPLKWKQALLRSEGANNAGGDFRENTSYPFGYYDGGEFKIGDKFGYHGSTGGEPETEKYGGRIWTEEKVISFWDYPDKKNLKKIVKNLEKKLKIKIWNNDYHIEIFNFDDKDEYIEYKDKLWNLDNDFDYQELIPLEDYEIGVNPPEEKRLQHLLDLETKAKMIKPEYFGSKADKRPLKWKQALLKSEKIKSFKDYDH